ncbi:MAG: thioesterase family protein, partial [Gammaproteobacteria bacterium]|nr:thioesterase family protein [Gammaproteobacteria bacterium]
YTVESQLTHRAEARVHEVLQVSTRVKEIDDKRLRLSHSLIRTLDEALLATAEQLYLHVDTAARRSAPFPPWMRARLAALQPARS